MVHHYRVYCLDRTNHVADVEWINAASDDEAVEIARKLRRSSMRELWLGDRLVTTIEPAVARQPSGAFWL